MRAMPRTHRVVLLTAAVAAVSLLAAAPALARFHGYSGSFYGSGTSALQSPHAIAVDNSTGPSSGDVYVTDTAAFRVEKFDAEGNFILMFGKEVNKTEVEASGTEAEEDVCTAQSGDECQAGTPTGVFANPTFIAVDGSSGPSAGDIYLASELGEVVSKFDPFGELMTSWGSGGLFNLKFPEKIYGITVAVNGNLSILGGTELISLTQAGTALGSIDPPLQVYRPDGLAIDGKGNLYDVQGNSEGGALVKQYPASGQYGNITEASRRTIVAFTVDQHSDAPYAIQRGASVQQFTLPCNPVRPSFFQESPHCSVAETFGAGRLSGASGIAIDDADGDAYVADTGHRRVAIFRGIPPTRPTISESVSSVHTESATLHALIGSTGEDTTYHFEYGSSDCSGNPDPCTATASTDIGDPQSAPVSAEIGGLAPDTAYHYRVLATNALGTSEGPDRTFTTYPSLSGADRCPNALVRQQTEAASLFDCRAYELVSAANAGGNSVASDLIAGQEPLAGYPEIDGRVLYATASGGIPGAGKPTNMGGDPYLAVRGSTGWSTEYVGIPADINQETGPFASTLGEADPSLGAFAFAGSKLCSPCLDGETGLPVRTQNGELVQGMAGSLDPGPGANADILVRKRFSADGTHLIFGSTSQFEPDATPGTPTIYDRDLVTDTTKVVSKLPGGGNIPCISDCSGIDGVAELGLSADGSRVLIGQLLHTDAEGNRYWHLYMNVGDSGETIDLTPGTTTGALFDGMNAEGTKVYFTTKDALATAADQDTDHSADIYRADVSASAATLTRVSIGSEGTGNTDACDPFANSRGIHWNSVGPEANCDAVAIAGGGGVAADSGDIYFLSPELLDGAANGTRNAPNLYFATPGQAPRYVSTLESSLNGPTPASTHHPFLHDFGGSFTNATATAIDSSDGDVYVLDTTAGVIKKFDAEGNPVSSFGDTKPSPDGILSGLETPAGSFELSNFFAKVTSIAVDQASGDLYVPDLSHNVIDVFDSSGAYLRQIGGLSFPTSVAVDPGDGDVYAASDSLFGGHHLQVFDSAGNPLAAPSVIGNPSSFAVDSTGTLYVGNGSEVVAYQVSTGNFLAQVDAHPATGLAIDPADDDLYVDEGNQISQFDPAGNRVGSPSGQANLGGSLGLAADSGSLFASNGTSVAAFGPPALDPSPAVDNPAVVDSLNGSEAPDSAAFEVSPSGDDAVFTSTLPLTGYENAGFSEVFRYQASSGSLNCASCDPAGAAGAGNARLASDGNSLTADGRVFFTTPQQLVLRDVNGKQDAYEWEGGKVQLISSGTGPFDSGLLSVSTDGTDAYFFTRDSLVSEDENGSQMKIYDARAGGGFFVIPPRPSCAASDECHGAGTAAPLPPVVGSVAGSPHNVPAPTKCKPGFVDKHGRCARKPNRKRRHPGKHHRRAGHNRGGAK